MSKTIRELTAATPVLATHILAVSREDTTDAFKTDITDIKDFILTSGGTAGTFLEVITPEIRSAASALYIYVSTSTISCQFFNAGIRANSITGLTETSHIISFATSSIEFKIFSSTEALVDATGLRSDKLASLTTAGTFIDLDYDIKFYISSTHIASIDSTGVATDRLEGLTTSANYIDFDDTGVGIYTNSIRNIHCQNDGQVFFEKRPALSAWKSADITLTQDVDTLITYDQVVFDPMSIFSVVTSKLTMPTAGIRMGFTMQLAYYPKAESAEEYVWIHYEGDVTNFGPGAAWVYFLPQTYIAFQVFQGTFTSSASPKGFYVKSQGSTRTLDIMWLDVWPLQ